MSEQLPGKPIRSPWRDWLARASHTGGAAAASTPNRRTTERRRHSLWSIAYGSFRPRRRSARRDGDEDRLFLDWHEPRVLYIALAIVLMCCTDALFTLNLLAVGVEEMNVLMSQLITHDVERFLAVKIGVTCVSVVVLGVAARRQFLGIIPVFRVLQVLCAGYAVLIAWELWLFAQYFTTMSSAWRP
ncbi:MAG: DUF5658 family protein [Gammaproteobacteria bacterium]